MVASVGHRPSTVHHSTDSDDCYDYVDLRAVSLTPLPPKDQYCDNVNFSGEMAIPQYTGRVADWIINEEAPDAFTEAITIMTLMTIAR